MNSLYLLIQEDCGDYMFWGKFDDTEEGRQAIQHIVRRDVPHFIVKGNELIL